MDSSTLTKANKNQNIIGLKIFPKQFTFSATRFELYMTFWGSCTRHFYVREFFLDKFAILFSVRLSAMDQIKCHLLSRIQIT